MFGPRLSNFLVRLGRVAIIRATRNLGTSIFLVTMSACLLATHDGIVKTLVQDVPMLQVIWLRFALQSIVVVSVLKAAGQRNLFKTKHLRLHAGRTAAILTAGIMMFTALNLMSLATATVILFLNPVLVALFSTIFLGEKIGPRRYLAIFLGFAGVLVVVNPSFNGFETTMFLPLGSAICAAIYVMLTRQLSDPDETLPTLILSPVAVALILTPIQFFIWEPLTATQIIFAVLLASVGTLGQTSLQFGLRGASAAVLSPFLYIQVAFAAGLSVIWFQDPFGINLMLGSLMIVGSGIVIWYLRNRQDIEIR